MANYFNLQNFPDKDKDVLIIFLLGIIALCLLLIWRLNNLIKKERHKRLVPFVTLEINPQRGGIFVCNKGGCSAKDIRIEEISIDLSYDFKKSVVLKFEPILFLDAGRETRLNFTASIEGRQLSPEESQRLTPHLVKPSFEARLSYANLENVPFSLILEKDQDQLLIKELKSKD